MGMANETDVRNQGKDFTHLLKILGVLRHHVFTRRLTWAGVREQEVAFLGMQLKIL